MAISCKEAPSERAKWVENTNRSIAASNNPIKLSIDPEDQTCLVHTGPKISKEVVYSLLAPEKSGSNKLANIAHRKGFTKMKFVGSNNQVWVASWDGNSFTLPREP